MWKLWHRSPRLKHLQSRVRTEPLEFTRDRPDTFGIRLQTQGSASAGLICNTASTAPVCDIDSVGALTAADILTEIGDPALFPTKAASDMTNRTALVEASSGCVRRHRLNRGDNR